MKGLNKYGTILSAAVVMLFTGAAVWLLYPVITAEAIAPDAAKFFFYRVVAGFAILIILFGKSLFDLFFPGKRPITWLDKAWLIVYSVIIGFALVVMIGRVLQIVLSNLNYS